MAQVAQAKEQLALSPEDFPRVAVNAMVSLQYKSEIYDEADCRLVFYDDAVESYGMDTWRCRYQAILSWKEIDGQLELVVKVKEKNYGDTHIHSCVDRVELIIVEILRAASRAKDKKEIEVPWRAKFAETKDLEEASFALEPGCSENELASGLLLGKFEDKKLWLKKDMKVRHVLVCGPTGCGKSTSIFIPNLIERLETSAIVTEASPGSKTPVLYSQTAGWRAKNGQKVVYFNPDDIRTMRLNPVDLVRTFDDAQMIAGLIVANTTNDSHMGDQIWGQAETHLLQALLLHAAGKREKLEDGAKRGDGANLSEIRRLLRKGPKGMEQELQGTRLMIARTEYEAFLNNSSPNFRFGVVSGLLARLALFANPKVAAATEVTDFTLDELAAQKFTMYLAVPVHRPDYLPLSALAFNFIFTFVMSKLDELKYPLTLYLDEFTNYGAIPGIARYLTVIRNAGIGAVLGVQDLAQLEYLYKDKLAQIIWSQPRTKVLFPPADDRMAERISKMLGQETEQEVVAASGHLSNRQFPRPLIDAADLLKLEKDGQYLVVSSTYPVRASRMKSWLDYPEETKLFPPVIEPLEIDDLEEMCRKESVGAGCFKNRSTDDFSDEVEDDESDEELSEGSEDTAKRSQEEQSNNSEGDSSSSDVPGAVEDEGDFWTNLRGQYK